MTAVIQEHNEQMDQEDCPWEDIETLTANGISAVIPHTLISISLILFLNQFDRLVQTDVKKLKDAGIQTVAALTMHTRKVRIKSHNV